MSQDFTFKKFHSLCTAIADNYPTITLAEYFKGAALPERFAIMRHDIDRRAGNALHTARIEQELGIRATYYFRMNNSVFKPGLIKKIEGMGHEVGYHYEVLGKADGDPKKAIVLFEKELKEFRKICDIKTICMHGNPISKYDDRKLWDVYDFVDFGIIGEAYLSAGKDIEYFSDTGRSWNGKNNIRDIMQGRIEKCKVENTDDIIELTKCNYIDKLYIATHPERWASSNIEWVYYYVNDFVCNAGKKVLRVVR